MSNSRTVTDLPHWVLVSELNKLMEALSVKNQTLSLIKYRNISCHTADNTSQKVGFLEPSSKIYPGNVIPWGRKRPGASLFFLSIQLAIYQTQCTFITMSQTKAQSIGTELNISSSKHLILAITVTAHLVLRMYVTSTEGM